MNRLEINPNNEKYYSKEFMQGYKCGTKSQFDADVKVLEQIRDEIEALPRELPTDARNMVRRTRVLEIIDKHIEGSRE